MEKSGFRKGEIVHYGGVCIPDTFGVVIGFSRTAPYVIVETETEGRVYVRPEDLFHADEKV